MRSNFSERTRDSRDRYAAIVVIVVVVVGLVVVIFSSRPRNCARISCQRVVRPVSHVTEWTACTNIRRLDVLVGALIATRTRPEAKVLRYSWRSILFSSRERSARIHNWKILHEEMENFMSQKTAIRKYRLVHLTLCALFRRNVKSVSRDAVSGSQS